MNVLRSSPHRFSFVRLQVLSPLRFFNQLITVTVTSQLVTLQTLLPTSKCPDNGSFATKSKAVGKRKRGSENAKSLDEERRVCFPFWG